MSPFFLSSHTTQAEASLSSSQTRSSRCFSKHDLISRWNDVKPNVLLCCIPRPYLSYTRTVPVRLVIPYDALAFDELMKFNKTRPSSRFLSPSPFPSLPSSKASNAPTYILHLNETHPNYQSQKLLSKGARPRKKNERDQQKGNENETEKRCYIEVQ